MVVGQAIGRAHRPEQKRPVIIIRSIVQDTIEEVRVQIHSGDIGANLTLHRRRY